MEVFLLEKVKVNRIIFNNIKTQWGILSIENKLVKDDRFTNHDITVSGNFNRVYINCKVNIEGTPVYNDKYGWQIKANKIEVIEDISSKGGIINFLTKSAIKGIHLQNAKKIYNKYGENSIDIVINHTEKLMDIGGIGDKTYQKIANSVDKYKCMKEVIDYSIKVGLTYQQVYKLFNLFGDDTLEIIKNKPYSILEKSDSFSFNQIDKVALLGGVEPDDDDRLEQCLLYTLKNLTNLNSSTGVPSPNVIKEFNKNLGLTNTQLYNYILNKLLRKDKIVIDNNTIYRKSYYETEKEIARIINKINSRGIVKGEFKKSIIDKVIRSFKFKLTEEQEIAIKKCLVHDFSILTSPAGCGKSTITKALVDIYREHGYNLVLLTPTGKATRRLEECTNSSSITIHKFLNVKDSIEDTVISKVPPKTVIIVDESSMIDIQIFAKLLGCVEEDTKIILVGDNNQLPSIQVGNILGDLIDSNKVNVCKLTTVMRQANDSTILDYCTKVNRGEQIKECNKVDFYYKQFNDSTSLYETLLSKYMKELDKNNLEDLQVLVTCKGGIVGDKNLNNLLGNEVNNNELNETFNFKVNDRVIHLKNNYKKNVFNGEVGLVKTISEEALTVDYSGKMIEYYPEDIDELQLAYSITIHKSQGSEYPVVFVVVDNEISNFLLIRKILYTAISRGKKKVYLLSRRGCVSECIKNNYFKKRYTKLKDFLK